MKALMITAPASGSGKTTLTLGLLRALKHKGLAPSAFKIGPDYIDRAFLEQASGKPAGNLDLHLMGQDGIMQSLADFGAPVNILEGVMGYFDGMGNGPVGSSFDLSRLLQVPAVLVYRPQGEMFSIIPKLLGMANFPGSMLKGVIFNHTSKAYYDLIKEQVQDYTALLPLGYLPPLPELALESRHLGLVQAAELTDLDQKLDQLAEVLPQTVDLDALQGLMSPLAWKAPSRNFHLPPTGLKVALAQDQAFSFTYRENLKLLESACQVEVFSPLKDKHLPSCDLLILVGGYPEVFAQELAANQSMRESIRAFGEAGGHIYAECGGLMYLTQAIEGQPMVGLLPGNCQMTNRLQRFGYIQVTTNQDTLLGPKGTSFAAHEFHKAVVQVNLPQAYQIKKAQGKAQWTCGYVKKNILAGFPHLNFYGHPDLLKGMLSLIQNQRSA